MLKIIFFSFLEKWVKQIKIDKNIIKYIKFIYYLLNLIVQQINNKYISF